MDKRKFLSLKLCATEGSGLSATETMTANKSKKQYKKAPYDTIFNQGEINPYSMYFTGQSYLTMLSNNDHIFNSPIGNVTFEPGTRTFWHKHSGGQILLIIGGEGRYCERGSKVQIIKKGDVIRIAPNVEHFHGAGPDTFMTHISVETNLPNNKATWLEPVSDEDYLGKE